MSLVARGVAHGAFVASGLVLVLLNQFLADCGVNSPFVGFGAAAKGGGFLSFAIIWWFAQHLSHRYILVLALVQVLHMDTFNINRLLFIFIDYITHAQILNNIFL